MSVTLATALVVLLGLLFVFPYVLYPAVVRLFSPHARRAQRRDGARDGATGDGDEPGPPAVSVLIPAHNEVRHVRTKLHNTLNFDYPSDRLEIVVCSDGSTDGTDGVVSGFAPRGVRLIRNEVRSGKAVALTHLLATSRHDLVMFTDASASVPPTTLGRLVAALADPEVGVAVARYTVRTSESDEAVSPEAESAYWDFEARLRDAESRRDMLLGGSGAAYLIRRSLVPEVPADTVNDDYIIPLTARLRGSRVAYVHDATASDYPTESSRILYSRWVRIAYGNFQMFARHPRAFWPGRPRVALPFVRKLLRTLGPWFLLAALGVALTGATASAFLAGCVGLAVVGLSAGAAAVLLDGTGVGDLRPVRVLRFATLAQAAYLQGALRFATRRGRGIWRRAPENELLDLTAPAPIPSSVRVLKRAVDIAGAVVALLLFSPIILVVAIWIRVDSPGSVFYVQERERPGPGGRPVPFRMFKFRSMKMDAEKTTGPVWAAGTVAGRVTRVGQVIRKFRLDELPQFINVLRGDMSIVGPRPERPFFTRMLEEQIPGYVDRISVIKPGITGWAQVNVATDTSVDSVREKVMHDLAYLAHLYGVGSYLKMELKVLWRTVFVMVSGKGAA